MATEHSHDLNGTVLYNTSWNIVRGDKAAIGAKKFAVSTRISTLGTGVSGVFVAIAMPVETVIATTLNKWKAMEPEHGEFDVAPLGRFFCLLQSALRNLRLLILLSGQKGDAAE